MDDKTKISWSWKEFDRLKSKLEQAMHGCEHGADEACPQLRTVLEEIGELLGSIEFGERQWRAAFDAVQEPIFFHDKDYRIVRANRVYAGLAGMEIQDVIGRLYWEVFPRGNGPLPQCVDLVEDCTDSQCEEVTLDSGETYQSRGFAVRDVQGDYLYSVHVMEDVTERKRIETKLNATSEGLSLSLHLLQGVIESVPIRVFWKDVDLRYLGCNALFAKDAGLSRPDELIGKTDFEMGWKDQADLYRKDDHSVITAGVAKLGYEEPQTTPDGGIIWLRTSKVPLRDDDGRIIGILGIYDDITRQKQMERDLLLSESRLKEAQSVAHLGSWELDLVNDVLWWSEENHRIFGVEQGAGNNYETFLNTVHPDDREFVNKAYTEAVKFNTPYDIEHRLLMPDGSVKWVHERCKTYYGDDGKPLRSIGTTLDITERKYADAQAARFGRLLDSSINEIYVFDAESLKFIQVNEGARRNLGYSMSELTRLTPLDIKVDFTLDAFAELITPLRGDDSNVQIFEAVHRRKNGSTYPVEVHLQFSAKEATPVFIATILDITQRHEADERLRHSEAGLAEAQRIAHLGNWELDIANNNLSWSDEIYRIFEIDPQRFSVSYESYLAVIHPDDRGMVDGAYRESVINKRPCAITHRLLMADGRIKYVRMMGETRYGDDGRPSLSVGTLQDITEQHLAEQNLNRSNRALKAISNCNSVLIHAGDEAELLDKMCRVIIDEGGYRLAWVGVVEDGEAKTVRPIAHAGINDGYLEWISVSYADNEFGHGPVGRAVRHGKPEVVHDILDDPHFLPWRAAAVERGYRSVLSLPLNDEAHEVFAVLSIYSAEPDAFDTEALSLMQELADDLAFGIHAVRTRVERDHYQHETKKSYERYRQMLVGTIRAISLTVEKRDPYTAGHQNRVAQLSVAIGRELGLDEDRLEGLRLGAMIHDIGKIYVPAEILNRPGRLSKAEFEIIKSHSEVGYDIVKDIDFPWPVAEMVIQHHERLDGSGYPRGLHGEEIILESRILAVADVIEAINSHRPYRPGLGLELALQEVETNSGIRYDPDVVNAILHLIRNKGFRVDEVERA